MKQDRKEWQKPELVIMVRSTPEEAVLGGCKFFGPDKTHTGTYYFCSHYEINISLCPECNLLRPS
jgi:hypothetical protein